MHRLIDRYLAPAATLIVVVVLLLGTYAQFALPYWRGGPPPQGCYFGDALIVFITCGDAVPSFVETMLTWSWYLTWGHFWLLNFFVPLAPVIGVPILIIWVGAIALAVRWAWRTFTRRGRSV